MTFTHDPLCPHKDEPFQHRLCPMCVLLKTARLQGPVTKPTGHAPFCWCRTCAPRFYEGAE